MDSEGPDQPAQKADQDLHCLLTESLGTMENMESKCLDDTLCMCGMDPNLCIWRMLEDTFSLGLAQYSMSIHVLYRSGA